ncbi:MAG: hybrid sensor histidine kinase/response regulator [Phycisphaeraceae bacterium]|nr:hybrid sensor histidine kinase/response regulator [Phycisphaeraceae bacterium]
MATEQSEHDEGASDGTPSRGQIVVFAAGLYAVLCGAITLIGWFVNQPRLTDWLEDGISMFPVTATCAIACGIGLLLLCPREVSQKQRVGAAILGALACALGLATLFEHATMIDLGIDTFLVRREWGQKAARSLMRMGPPASVSFAALGSSIVLLALGGKWSRRIASALGVLCAAIASLSLIGYFYGVDQLFALPKLTGIARQAATAIFAIGIAVVTLVPELGLANLMSRRDGGGVLARRVLPAAVFAAIMIGWLRLQGQDAHLYDTAFGTAIRTLVEIGLFLLLIWWTANGVSAAESKLRKSREELRAALDEATTMGRFKDEFLATLSHELRNPMTAILGWSGIVRKKMNQGKDVELAHGLEVIERNAKLQAQMIDDLLDVSRIAAGKVRLNIQNVDLREVVRSAVDVVKPGAEAKGLSIQVFFGTGLPPIRGDSTRLQQVLFNLLVNALKFTPSGGAVKIECTRIGSAVQIAVADTGVGIEPEFLPHVFERFRQQDAATTKKYGGLGLGLAIVRQLVELHGGRVTAQSEGAGKGATFTITLLTVDSALSGAQGVTGPGETPNLIGTRVLVVDDDDDVRDLLNRMLSGCGATVTLARSVDEALEKVECAEPDVLLSDIGMPGKDGYDLVWHLRQRGIGVYSVALTSFASAGDRARALQAGFDTHVSKPVHTQELFAAIRGAKAE